MCKSKICFGRIPPKNTQRNRHDGNESVAVVDKLWANGSTLKVRFMGGTVDQQGLVKRFASKWSEFANISFLFNNAPDAEIRIKFDLNGSWSYVGKDALLISRDKPTMNLAHLDEATILHEFGHAIGLVHEHQHPENDIQWNKARVYEELSNAPNHWDKKTIDLFVFDKYDRTNVASTDIDKDSIMIYPIPERWTLNNFSTRMNYTLSARDKQFIGKMYPKDTSIVKLHINNVNPYKTSISKPGEVDIFKFEVTKKGVYVIETTGTLDMIMSLLGSNNTDILSTDDDSGTNKNSKIEIPLEVGYYHLQLRHFNGIEGQGDYGISIKKTDNLSV